MKLDNRKKYMCNMGNNKVICICKWQTNKQTNKKSTGETTGNNKRTH